TPLSGVKVQAVQFPEFSSMGNSGGAPIMGGNMDLMMNVPLNVSVEIGSTKRKIKDIMEFNQGSVIELEKQAGAPVDVVVNGQLFARGDVIVVDDNFGVRITEILGTKELLSSLENKQ
ncbi:MAG: flagellar motor switch protein FliN, partial [Angelakisella sp.]